MRWLGRMTLLVALWLLAWGDISLVNLISGITVAWAMLLAFPQENRASGHVRVRPAGVVRLIGYVVSQLVTSNVLMARQILRPHPQEHPAVIAHRLRQPSEVVATVMTSVIALSPGTMTVDVDPGSTTIYVHFFRLYDPSSARALLNRLERLVVGAITTTPADMPAATSEEPV